MVTIYADTLVFLNMFITYFLLLTTQLICRRTLHRLRLLASSALGGVYALTILLEPIPLYVSVPMRFLVCAALCAIVNGKQSIRRFLKGLCVFLLVNFIFAGLMFALQMLRPQRLLYQSGVVYLDVDTPFLLLSTLFAYLIIRIAVWFGASKNCQTTEADVTIRMHDAAIRCVGLLDTGHRLTDPFTGKPVLIANERVIASLVPPQVLSFLRGQDLSDCDIPPSFTGKLRLFPFQSVGAGGLLPAFRCTRAVVAYRGKTYTQDHIYIAVTNAPLFAGEADVLLPQEVYEEMEGKRDHAVSYHPSEGAVAAHSSEGIRAADPLRRLFTDAAAAARKKRGSGSACPSGRRR